MDELKTGLKCPNCSCLGFTLEEDGNAKCLSCGTIYRNGQPMEQRNEPSTEEIVRNFRGAHIFGITQALENRIADRLESQEQTIAALTARAEQAERERDAAKADMKLIVDEVRETHCDETCCFACKHDCDASINYSGEFNNECPGFDRDDCFEWRGLPQNGEGK